VRRNVLHGAAAALVLAGLAAQLTQPLAPSLSALPSPNRWFDPAYLARAAAYWHPRYAAALVMVGVRVAVPCIVTFTGRGRRVVDRIVERIGPHRPARAAACVVVVVVALTDLLLLPLKFWVGYVHEGIFGFRTQGVAGWARDWAVSVGLAWVAVGAAALGAWTLARRVAQLWPPVVALSAAGLIALLTLAAPRVIEPLLFHTRPLEPGFVRTKVEQLLARADLRVDQILVADASRRTTKENAYVSGLGATRQVVLYDTLLVGRTPAEIGLVVAHELGHLRDADDVRGALLGGAGAVVLVYGLAALIRWRVATGRQDGQADPRAAAVVVAVAVLASVLGTSVHSAFNRRAEAAADLASLDLTADPATYERAHIDLTRANLADPAPPGWVTVLWMTHPSPVARLEMGKQWPFLGQG
jgi:STE24 endopeptidase